MQEYHELIAPLQGKMDSLPPGKRAFAMSLLSNYRRTGSLSEKQWPWVKKLYEHKPEERQSLGGNFAPLAAMLRLAAGKLKRPTIRILVDHEKISVYPAKEGSKNPGWLYVTGPGRSYLGKIHMIDGDFVRMRACSDAVVQALEAFAKDPIQAATAYGKLLEECCFCGRHLEDDRSKRVGYGPVCADTYHLPWGEKDD